MCKQYNNFESTQTSKIRIFSAFGRTAWFHTQHNVSNSALAAPRRLFSSGPILLSQIKHRFFRNHIISIGFFDACFTSHWEHFQFFPIQLQPIHTPSLFDAHTTHNSRPSQSYGPRGTWENYYNQTSAFQAPLYKSLLMRAPCLRFGRLKP